MPVQADFVQQKDKICVIGLGYVGLPLAETLSRKYCVAGFDIDSSRISELKKGQDKTNEISSQTLQDSGIEFYSDPNIITSSGLIIVTVPTPIDKFKKPDLKPVEQASIVVGRHLRKDSVVVYESTVYPGVTEDVCVPILEKESGLIWKKDFFVGYSPERVNPGDKLHTIDKIQKVISGDTAETAAFLADIYAAVIPAGIHLAPNIKTAEAAKVIENTQRDLNIALMNELSLIFDKMEIDTQAVLEAAGTKWNFIDFKPGLVGGHCIGVDPYYLTFKAENIGYHPQIILAGRRINDNMGKYVAESAVKRLIQTGVPVKGSKILILGLTFKENISDIRNTKVVDIYSELNEYGCEVFVHDAYAHKPEVKQTYGIELINQVDDFAPYNVLIMAVGHKEYKKELTLDKLHSIAGNGTPVLIDIKAMFSQTEAENSGFLYWRL